MTVEKKTGEGNTNLVNNVSENLVLIIDTEFLRLDNFWLDDKQHHGIIHRTAHSNPITPRIQHGPHGLDILPQPRHNLRLFLQ